MSQQMMEQSYPVSREDLYNLQMEMKQVQYAQSNHAERILRLEKRQADDSAIKSAWNSPFPGVLASTPQHGELTLLPLFNYGSHSNISNRPAADVA